MKLTLFIVVALSVAVTSGLSKVALRGAVAKCSKAAKAPPATFAPLLQTRKIPDSQLEKCFMGCFYKEVRLIKDGALNYELAKGLADLEYSSKPEQHKKAISIIETCKSIKGISDECTLGYKLRECLVLNSDDSFTPFLVQ